MPRADKTFKEKRPKICRVSKAEKDAFEAIGHAPKFPKRLEGLKKYRKTI